MGDVSRARGRRGIGRTWLALLVMLAASIPVAQAALAADRVGGELVLYEFDEGSGTTVADTSGTGTPLDLTIADPGNVTWGPGGLTLDAPTVVQSAGAASKVNTAVAASGAISVELWVEPTNTTQDGPARMLSISSSSTSRNVTLGQGRWGSQPSTVFDARLRTTTIGANGQPSLTTPTGTATTDLTHVVFTRTPVGVTTTYVDGTAVATGTAGGDLSNWSSTMPLLLGNEANGSRPWLGRYCLAAVYDTALTAQQVAQNTTAGCEAANTPPTAVDDDAQVVANEAVTIDVAANDTDSDGSVDPTTIELDTTGLTLGSAELVGTEVTYTAGGATGIDTFTYTIADDDGDRSEPATVTVEVREANAAPVISPEPGDQANDEGDLVTLAVEATDTNGDDLTWGATGLPPGLTIDAGTGVIAGTLPQTSVGTYPVEVTVADGFGGEDTTGFTWTVTAVNVAPTIEPIADQQDPLGDVSLQVVAEDPDGDDVTYGATGLPPGVDIDPTTGLVSGTATDAGEYAVTVTANDPTDGEASESFTWTIVEVVVQPLVEYEFAEGSGATVADTSGVGAPLDLTIATPGNASWLPNGLQLDAATTVSSGGAATKVTQAVAASGEITVDLYVRPTIVEQDGPARILSISSSATARDLTVGHGRWGSQPKTVYDVRLRSTERNVNGQPAVTTPAGTVTDQLQHVVYTRAADGTATIAVDGSVVVTDTVGGTLANWSTTMPLLLGSEADGTRPWLGAYCYAAVYDEVVPLADLSLRQDGCDLADDNAAPVIDAIADQTSDRGDVVDLQASASDPDGDPVTFTGEGLPPGLSIDADGLISGTVAEEAGGDYEVTITATDPGAASDSTTFTWTVVVPNTPPTAVDDDAQVVQGEAVSIDVAANDTDVDGVVVPATIVIVDAPTQGTAALDGTEVLYTSTGATGTDTFTYTIEDDDGAISQAATVTVDVRAANSDPDVTPVPDQANDEGQTVVPVVVAATDADGDTLSYDATDLPPGLSIDAASGEISGTLTQTSAGTYPVVVTVTDGVGGEATASFTWTVTEVNVAPTIDPIADQQDTTGDTVEPLTVTADDADGDTLEYLADGLPEGLTLDPASGEINGTISAVAGAYAVTITAADPGGEFADTEFTWTVIEPAPRADGAVALYEFGEGSGSTVADTSGVGDALDLTIGDTGNVTWAPGALTLDASTALTSAGDATKIIDAVTASEELSIEAWVTPANTTQDGPARIVSISESSTSRDVTLGQGTFGSAPTDTFDLRLRSTITTANGTPSTTTPAGTATTDLTHLVATRAADGSVSMWVDGVEVQTSTVGGSLSAWAPMPLVLGNEADGDRPWLGTYCLAAVYDRALTPGEVAQNFGAGCEVDSQPSARIAILDGSDSIEASTFNAGSFLVENTSTSGTTLTSFSLDLSTALYHDVVFDPDGDAGDAGSKCFTPDAGDATTVGLQEPAGGTAGSCDNSMLSGPNAGGYDAITLTFDDFDATESFGFSIDNDPTSIQGVPITGNSGSISGFELVGSTVTLTFREADGSTTELTGRLFAQDGTDANGVNDGAAELVLSAVQAPAGPVSIDVLGAGLADLGYPNGASGAVVSAAQQQVAITGPANADVRLLVVESSYDEPVGFDKDPFEANKAEVITAYDVTLDGNGDATVAVTLPDAVDTFDDNNGDLYHLVAGVAAGGTYPSTSNLVYLELDPTAGPASPVVAPIANVVVAPDELLEVPVTATDANGDDITLTLTSTPDVEALGATFEQPAAGVGEATLSWTPTIDDLGTYEVTITASDPTAAPDTEETFTITVSDQASSGSALIAINPGASGIDASTFGNGSFQVTNTSTGGQTITDVSFDLSTAWLPDVVFDPVGLAGDATAKCLVANTGGTATGFVAPGDACVDPFSQPHNGIDGDEGFDVLTASFGDFDASETFAFSVDVDPTSIKDVGGAGNAGAVSGFELTGSTVTVTFSDGTVVAEPFRTGTLNGAASVVADATPRDAVTLDVAGVTLAPQPALSDAHSTAAVGSPTQTVLLSGPANADVRLLRVEAARVQTPSYDPDPFEANKAIAIEAYDVTLDGSGQGQVEVTLTDTATGTVSTDVTGLNHLMAVIGAGEATGPLSNVVVLDLTDGPTAVDDLATTAPGGQVAIDVLANDTSAVGLDPSSVTVTSGPLGGNLGAGPDPTTGVITYNAEQGFADAGGDSFTYTVADTDGNVSNEATVTITDETATVALYRVNAGGAEYVDTLGRTWAADTGFLNGTAFPTGGPKTGEPIAGTEDDLLYQSERFGGPPTGPPLQYAFAVDPGVYTVEIHLAEIYFGATTTPNGPGAAGQRVFSGTAEGQSIFTNLDLFAEDGAGVARVETIQVQVDDGTLDLEFLASADNAKVSAIAVLGGPPPSDVPPTVDAIADATVQVDQSLEVPITTTEPDGDPVTLTWSSVPDASGFTTFVDAGDGTGTLTFDPTAGDVGDYEVTVTATDVDGSDDEVFTLSVTEPPTGGQVLARINAGGPAVAAGDGGPVWEADTNPGHPYLTDGGSNGNAGFAAVEPGPTVPTYVPGVIFDTERWSTSGFSYGIGSGIDGNGQVQEIPVGTQVLVRLFFGNGFAGTSEPGQRVFDISIDGVVVEDGLDLSDRFGHQVGGMLEYLVTSDGIVDIGFSNDVENPLLNGLEVVVAESAPGELGVSPASVDFGQTLTGGSKVQTLTLANRGFEAGDPDVVVSDVTSDDPAFTVDLPVGGITLPPDGEATLDVTFSPPGVGSYSGTVSIVHSGVNSPVDVAVQGTGSSSIPVSFGASGLAGESSNNPTSLEFGPDGRLYVAQQDGTIYAYDVDRVAAGDYDVTATEQIDEIKQITNHNDDGTVNTNVTNRQVTGLVTAGTQANPVLYVSSSDPRIGAGGGGNDLGLDTNSGVISKLTWNGSTWDRIDLVRGLPRSEENHSTNGLDIDPATNTLYVMQGGHANKGAPSNNFAGTSEYYLSAAMLSVDLDAVEALPVQTDAQNNPFAYDMPTLVDPTRDDTATDPFGGNNGLNQAIPDPDGPVQIYSPGYRNAYDVVFTEGGKLYTSDNGPNTNWGGLPLIYDSTGTLKGHELQSGVSFDAAAGDYCTNDFNEGGSNGHGDPLHHVSGPGYYGGHPTPIRAFPGEAGVKVYVDSGSGWNLTEDFDFETLLPAGFSLADFPDNPIECSYSSNDPAKHLDIINSSTNGIAEYTASNFGGAMQGNLLTASFNGNINRYELNAAGDDVAASEVIFSGFGATPLDVTTQGDDDPFPGTVWAATYGADNITVFEPADYDGGGGPVCTGADDPALDEDGDGFDNADEIAAGTDPCSGGSVPTDADGDFTSDVTDTDDDNDGILDVDDPFAIDATNGIGTTLPVLRPLENEDPATGFFGLGFTGLMTNGTDTWLDQFDEGNLAAGGAVGALTVEQVPPGDAITNNNTQEYAFQYGVDVDDSTAPFVVHTQLEAPFFTEGGTTETPVNFESNGMFIGTGGQDDYLKLVFGGNNGPGTQVLLETGGTVASSTVYDTVVTGDWLAANQVDLYLEVDPATATAQPRISLDSGTTIVDLGAPVALPTAWFDGTDDLGLAVGIISTSFQGTPFAATWDFLDVTLVDGPEPTEVLYRVNAGGEEVAASDGGPAWSEDRADATTGQAGGAATTGIPSPYVDAADGDTTFAVGPTTPIDLTGVAGSGAEVEALFETERYRVSTAPNMTWTFPADAGDYEVVLYGAEVWSGEATSPRVMDVVVEGATVETGLRWSALAGGTNTATSVTYPVTVSDGDLVVELVPDTQNPKLSAIEVRRAGPPPTGLAPTVDPIADQTALVDETTLVDVSTTEPDGDVVTLSVDGPGFVSLVDAGDGTGSLEITPTAGDVGTYTVTVDASDDVQGAGTGASFELTVEDQPAGGQVLFRVNAGGPAVTAIDGGPDWSADTTTTPSDFKVAGSNSTSNHGAPASIDGTVPSTTPAGIWPHERWDNAEDPEMAWEFPVDPGTQVEVRLYLRDGFSGTNAAGARIYDVLVEDALFLDDFEPFVDPGWNVGTMRATTVTTSADGILDIDFVHVVENPSVRAIEIIESSPQPGVLGASPAALSFPTTLVAGGTAAATTTLSNLGTAGDPDITIDQVDVTGTHAADFVAGAPSAIVLAPGESATVEVTFDPSVDGTRTASLDVAYSSTAGSDTTSVDLSGVGTLQLDINQLSWDQATLSGESSNNPTSLDFGPDGRLYVGQFSGLIYAYDVERATDGSYSVTATETIDVVNDIPNYDDQGNPSTTSTRLVLGLDVVEDPAAPGEPVIYVTSSHGKINSGTQIDTNSGALSKLTKNGSGGWDKVDLVYGLPRSQHDHAVNGVQVDEAAGVAYVAVGGNTNQGARSNNLDQLPEYALSAAIVSVDLTAVEALGDSVEPDNSNTYKYVIPTVEDPSGASLPWGGKAGENMGIIVDGGPVQVHSPGYRNAYDVVLTQNGNLYTVDNGPNGSWGEPPNQNPDATFASGDCTDSYYAGGGSTSPDQLHLASEGFYGGHPNVTRANPTEALLTPGTPPGPNRTGAVPGSWTPNEAECDYKAAGTDDALATFGASTNGITEYTSALAFDGALQNALLTASFNGDIWAMIPASDGSTLSAGPEKIFTGFGSQPLDVTAQGDGDVFPGTVWAATYGADTIVVWEPTGGVTCDTSDPAGDPDGDGYTNEDETANGTNPCNNGSRPPDADGDGVGDAFDTDDDNDGLLDTHDPFAVDADNGATTDGVSFQFAATDPQGGLLDTGFTGLMTNATSTTTGTDYLDVFNVDDIIPGGTAPFLVNTDVKPGDAYQGGNNQEDAFQVGVNVGSEPFSVTTSLANPDVTDPFQSFGMFIGDGTQANYLKMVVGAAGSGTVVQVLDENDDVASQTNYDGAATEGATEVVLRFDVTPNTPDASSATVVPSYVIDGGAPVELTPVVIPMAWFDGPAWLGAPSSLATGLIATSNGGVPFAANWGFFEVAPAPPGNAPPTVEASPNPVTVESDATVDVAITTGDADGDTVTTSLASGAPTWATLSPDGATLTLAPGAGDVQVDPYVVTVEATDGTDTSTIDVEVTVEAPAAFAQALVEVIPGSSNINASTFGQNSFQVTNQSDAGVLIEAVEFDLTDSILPDMVFDPEDGTSAGDTTNVCFVPNTGATETGLTTQLSGGANCGPDGTGGFTDALLQPYQDGFLGLRAEFSDFGPDDDENVGKSYAFGFRIDNDPTTIKDTGAPGPGESGSVSGLELVGSTVTVEFSNGQTHTAALFSDGSQAGAVAVVGDGLPDAPTISVGAVGVGPATVTEPAQTVTVTGPEGADVELLRVEGGQFLPAGGGFDVDALEANSAVDVELVTGLTIPSGGNLDVPVTLTRIDPLTVNGDAGQGGINHLVAVVRDADGRAGAASEVAVVSYDPDLLHRVNVNGPATADPNGDWLADGGNGAGFLLGGPTNTFSSSSNNGVPVTTSDGTDPVGTPLAIYETERWDPSSGDPMTWSFPVDASGTYEVRLYLAEIYGPVASAGTRVFDVEAEGAIPTAFDDLDPYAITGGTGIGTVATATVTEGGDGFLDLVFLHTGADNPAIKGIEIRSTTP